VFGNRRTIGGQQFQAKVLEVINSVSPDARDEIILRLTKEMLFGQLLTSIEQKFGRDNGEMAKYAHDPLGWVMQAFPWNEGELEGFDGPDVWQREFLEGVGEQLRAGVDASVVIQETTASGHGIGKSALVSWLIFWASARAKIQRVLQRPTPKSS
jgi:hypothetical protein